MSSTGRTLALKIPPKHGLMLQILRSERQTVVLPGRPDIKAGDKLVLYCLKPPFVVDANIWGVRSFTIGELDQNEIKAVGHTHVGNLLSDLQQESPALNLTSVVTVVKWTNIGGELARQADRFEVDPSVVVRQLYQAL